MAAQQANNCGLRETVVAQGNRLEDGPADGFRLESSAGTSFRGCGCGAGQGRPHDRATEGRETREERRQYNPHPCEGLEEVGPPLDRLALWAGLVPPCNHYSTLASLKRVAFSLECPLTLSQRRGTSQLPTNPNRSAGRAPGRSPALGPPAEPGRRPDEGNPRGPRRKYVNSTISRKHRITGTALRADIESTWTLVHNTDMPGREISSPIRNYPGS